MRTRAFTLIELLVVIAIIGLLASIVMASLSNARAKATLAAGMQFASTVENAAGDQVVASYDFNDCAGTSVFDKSGSGDTGTLVSSAMWSSVTPYPSGCSIAISLGNYMSAPLNNLPTGAAPRTLSAWIYATSLPSGEEDFLEYGTDSVAQTFGIASNSSGYHWLMHFGGTDFDSGVPVAIGVWNFLAITYDGSAAKLYLNGAQIGAVSIALNTGSTNFFVGKHLTNSSYFNGYVDNVRIYAKTLTASEVRGLFASEQGSLPRISMVE